MKDLEKMISDNWSQLAVPGRLEAGCPPPFRIRSSFFYDGGTITLLAGETELLTIEREVEFGRLEIRIPEALKAREEKILSIMDQLCDRAIRRGIEEADLTRQARASRVFDMLDALPDTVEAPKTAWAIARIGEIDKGFIAGPFHTIEMAMANVVDHIAVEVDGRSSRPLRGFTMDGGNLTWYDAETCLNLKTPEADDNPGPGQ